MRHLEDKKDLKAEAKEKKLAQNKPKLDEARAKLQLATTQLMGFFGECHEVTFSNWVSKQKTATQFQFAFS